MYRVVFLTGPPLNFLSTGSNANWPGISLSVSSHKGILYLENLGGVQLKKPPCRLGYITFYYKFYRISDYKILILKLSSVLLSNEGPN